MTEMPSDIAAARDRLKVKIGGGREIKRLDSYLYADERVEQLAVGRYGFGNGLAVLTDRRILFVIDSVMTKHSEDFPFSSVSSVSWQSGVVNGTIIISAAGVRSEIKRVNKDDGKRFVDNARAYLSGAAHASPAGSEVMGQIQQLGALHEAGVLTDEEFANKKAELLGRI
jgi:Short C-terminal domain/Bacterial PH domain